MAKDNTKLETENKTENESEAKAKKTLSEQAGTPTAHVPITLTELKDNKILEKMGLAENEVTNFDVNQYVRKLVGLPEKVRAVSSMSSEKKQGIKDVSKFLRGMTEEQLTEFAKKNKIDLSEIKAEEEKKE